MKRLHVHASVKDIPVSIRFYRVLFNAEPTTGESTVYGTDVLAPKASRACCMPDRAA